MVEIAQYSIARFRPFPETGEFANIGIVASHEDQVAFKVVPRRYRRITQFFNTIEPSLFGRAIDLLTDDLNFIKEAAARRRGETGGTLRTLAMRNEETTILFSEVRTVILQDSLEDVTEKLYSRYIGRNFANADYTEQQMVRNARNALRNKGIKGFQEQVIEDGVLQVKFPLVSKYNGIRVIRPIALTQKTPLGVLDHAATWHDRLNFLIKRGALQRDKVLVPLAGPLVLGNADSGMIEAYNSARDELRALKVEVIDRDDEAALLAFAREGAQPQSRLFH